MKKLFAAMIALCLLLCSHSIKVLSVDTACLLRHIHAHETDSSSA